MRVAIAICGFGRVGRAFAELVLSKEPLLHERFGLEPCVVAAVDIGGAAVAEGSDGRLPLAELLGWVRGGGAVEQLARWGRPRLSAKGVLEMLSPDVWVEATPTNIVDAEPAYTHIKAALARGAHVVSANKGPLVLYFDELQELARRHRRALKIGAATAAALPTVDVGEVCLGGTEILSIEGILNGTTNYILTRMHDGGCTYEQALGEAQKLGIAEPDPRLDVEGWDTANKLVVIGNALMAAGLSLGNFPIKGITEVTPDMVTKARESGKVIKLLGRLEKTPQGVRASVGPAWLEASHPLAAVKGSEKALSFLTDTMDRVTVSGGKSNPVGAAAAMLKDIINIFAFPSSYHA